MNINWIQKLKIAIAALALLGLAACGGAGGGGEGIPQSYAPLQTAAAFQAGVLVVDKQNVSTWKVIATLNDAVDAPAILFEVPKTQDVQIGKVYIVDKMAYKIDSVESASSTSNYVHVSQPDIKEIFSTFKITGDLPITNMDMAADPAQTGVLQAGVAQTSIKWNPKALTSKDYAPEALAELGKCLKVEVAEGAFKDGGRDVKPIGFHIKLDKCSLALDATQKPIGINGDFGVYPTLSFKDGFDLADSNTHDQNRSFNTYIQLNGGLSFGAKKEVSKLLRFLSIKTVFAVPVPVGPIVVPVYVTVWIPLDMIIQGDINGTGSITWDTLYKYSTDNNKVISLSDKPALIPSLTGELSASLAVLLRPGVGIGVYGIVPFSIHPKGGLKGELKQSVIPLCTSTSIKWVWGLDGMVFPDTSLTLARGLWEKTHTKEIIPLLTGGELYASDNLWNGGNCANPIANITERNMGQLPAPIAYKLLNDGEIRDNGMIDLNGSTSQFNDTYRWEAVDSLGISTVIGREKSLFLFTKPVNATKITLTVENGPNSARKVNKATVNLVANKLPIIDGLAEKQGNKYILTSLASDIDGWISKVEWEDVSNPTKVIARRTAGGISAVDASVFVLASGSTLPTLRLKVWDNDGAVTEKVIQATDSTPMVSSILPDVAVVNIPQIFTVTGTNLPPTTTFAMPDATCQAPILTASGFTVSCTPTLVGSKGITITDAPAGNPIAGGTMMVNVSAAAVAVTSSCGAPVTNVLFAEDFLAPLSPTKWTVDSTGGTVTSGGGLVAVSGSGSSRFPYVQSVSNPFPATGNFSLYCKAKYSALGNNGTGACVGSQLVVPPGGAAGIFNSGLTFSWWGDTAYSEAFSANTNMQAFVGAITQNLYISATPSPSVVHEYETCVIGSTATTYRDGVQIGTATLPVGWSRPAYVWFGNPVVGYLGVWSSFETYKIEVRQLGAAVAPMSGNFTVNAINEAGTPFTVPTGATACTFAGSGTWKWDVPSAAVGVTGGGATYPAAWMMLAAPVFSLVANTPSGYAYIGASAQVPVTAGSILNFKMNDVAGTFSDNSGAASVTWSCQ